MELVHERSLEDAIRAFSAHDKEGKGWISSAQAVRVFQEIGPKLALKTEPRDLVADADPQASGKVMFPDYLLLVSRKLLEGADPELHDAFATFHRNDVDKKGTLSVPLVRHVLSSTNAHHVDTIDLQTLSRALDFPEELSEASTFNFNEVLAKQRSLRDPTPYLEEVFASTDD